MKRNRRQMIPITKPLPDDPERIQDWGEFAAKVANPDNLVFTNSPRYASALRSQGIRVLLEQECPPR